MEREPNTETVVMGGMEIEGATDEDFERLVKSLDDGDLSDGNGKKRHTVTKKPQLHPLRRK